MPRLIRTWAFRIPALFPLAMLPLACQTTWTDHLYAPQPLETARLQPAQPARQANADFVLVEDQSLPAPRPEAAQPYTLEQLTALAEQMHPDLTGAFAQVEAARGEFIQQGLYPNPSVSYQGQEINNPDNRLGFQGTWITQEIVTAGKLRLAQTAAAHGITVATWQAVTTRYEIITQVRMAYYDLLEAERELEVNQTILQISKEVLERAKAAERAGVGGRADVIRSEAEVYRAQAAVDASRQRVDAAWKLLALAVAQPELPRRPLAASLDDPVPHYEYNTVLATALINSSLVQAAQADVLRRESALARAQVEPIPNIQVQGGPTYDFPNRSPEANLQIGVNLPLFDRNQGNILAARAQLVAAQQRVRSTELEVGTRLTQAWQRYQVALEQVETYKQEIVPRAAEYLRLVQAGYAAGDPKFDYDIVLLAQQNLIEAKRELVRLQGELWKAVVEIAGVVQQEKLTDLPPRDKPPPDRP
ncbi:MAG: TolC family protein [Gemmatales bacterium]|nr:TolC family protein [Gemmatales bacterium]MDW8385686.1 TolC family protein [Gemmatales bacterium]